MTDRPRNQSEMNELFEERFADVAAPAVAELERAVLGSAYGGSSYTTIAQADAIAGLLRLGEDSLLVSIGGGAGWPSLHLAATTGCSVVITDPTLEGLRAARFHAERDGTEAWLARCDGGALPLADRSVDAVEHSDVLC